ncbi:MAG: tetratricopeptide repeat protein [Phycisphaerae bacterium]
MRRPVREILLLLTTAAAALAVGCADRNDVESDVRYRTVRAEPLRDTRKAQDLNARGIEQLRAGDLDAAEKTFRQAIEADVSYGPAHNNLGKVYLQKKDLHPAALEFQAAIDRMPDHAGPLNNLAMTWEQAWVVDPQLGSLDRAIELYRRAVQLDAENIRYKANLARALDRRGDRTDELRKLIDQILQQDTRADWLIWARKLQARLGQGR